MSEKLLRFGIVGIGGRPMAFLSAFAKSGKATLAAVCDIDREIMDKNTEGIDGVLKFTDYEEMSHPAVALRGNPQRKRTIRTRNKIRGSLAFGPQSLI